MRKAYAIICTIVMLAAIVPVTQAQGSNWSYSEDYTQVTLNGKTYDNFLVLVKEGDRFFLHSMATRQLQNTYNIGYMDQDVFFADLPGYVSDWLANLAGEFPQKEIISINYLPWHQTAFKQAIIDAFSDSSEAIRRFIENEDALGYAYDVFEHNIPLDVAKRQFYPLVDMPIYTKLAHVYRSSEEFEADDNLDGYSGKAISLVKVGTYGDYIINHKLAETIEDTGEIYTDDADEGLAENGAVTTTPCVSFVEVPGVTAAALYLRIHQNLLISSVLKVGPDGPSIPPINPHRVETVHVRIIEQLGAKVEWLEQTKQVRITSGNMVTLITIGSRQVTVNGEARQLPVAPVLEAGKTMLPINFVAAVVGSEVDYDLTSKQLSFTIR